ncbi:MAG: hypothetical protein PHY77_03715 [Desulfotomaculaceae bacterium]|nr:hypothetical protein [Desulfotomaculaceae bacterium]
MSTWCNKVRQILNAELKQICHLARLATPAPNEEARMMVLRLISEELDEVKFWNNILCCACDKWMPDSPGVGYQPGIPTPCPIGPSFPPANPGIGVGPSIGTNPGVNIGSDTFGGPGMLPAPGMGMSMGPSTPIFFPELSAGAYPVKGDLTNAGPDSTAAASMPPAAPAAEKDKEQEGK